MSSFQRNRSAHDSNQQPRGFKMKNFFVSALALASTALGFTYERLDKNDTVLSSPVPPSFSVPLN